MFINLAYLSLNSGQAMDFKGKIRELPTTIKIVLGIYLVVTGIGFLSALQFVGVTTGNSTQGIVENYLGNEEDMKAEVMKFPKTERQILNIVHAHMLSMAMLFLVLALLVALTPLHGFFRNLLLYEPLISVLFTFGGIFFLWKGVLWMKYVVWISGALMTFSFVGSTLVVLYFLISKRTNRGH
ncbi:MAG: hypothetical protein AAGA86_00040 [Bacteroidota bacterium]